RSREVPVRRPSAARRGGSNGGEGAWGGRAALPDCGRGGRSASTVVAYVAGGAAAILSRSVTEAVGRTRVGSCRVTARGRATRKSGGGRSACPHYRSLPLAARLRSWSSPHLVAR